MNLKELLLDFKIKLLFFGGKGGVGKTTFASASAIWAADNGRNVLIISTDPAHSLSDSFDQNLKFGEITPIQGVDGLFGLEIQSKSDFNNVLGEIDKEVSQNKETDLFGDLGGISALLNSSNLTLPGMDEIMAFGRLLDYIKDTDYDLIIFDTAPTGHTLRFLSLPNTLSGWVGGFLKFKLKISKLFSVMKSKFSQKKSNEESSQENIFERFDELKFEIENIKKELTDENRTSFIIVMIPEAMAVYESERLLGSLMEYNISVNNIIINHIIPENTGCNFCMQRRKMQLKYIETIRNEVFPGFKINEITLFSEEIRTIDCLRRLGKTVFG